MNIKGPYTSTSKEQKDYDDSGKNKLNLEEGRWKVTWAT